jgi:hypothetical protein
MSPAGGIDCGIRYLGEPARRFSGAGTWDEMLRGEGIEEVQHSIQDATIVKWTGRTKFFASGSIFPLAKISKSWHFEFSFPYS